MLIFTILAAWLVLIVAPETPIGKALLVALVRKPAAWLDHVRRGHVVLVLATLLIAGIAIYWGGGDAAAMLSMASPEFLGWAAMFDIATYVDVVVALSVVAATARLRPIVTYAARCFSKRSRHPRASRARRQAGRKVAHDNDDGGWRYLMAA